MRRIRDLVFCALAVSTMASAVKPTSTATQRTRAPGRSRSPFFMGAGEYEARVTAAEPNHADPDQPFTATDSVVVTIL